LISLKEAYEFTQQIYPAAWLERVGLLEAEGRIAGHDLLASEDSPSLDVSIKDGYTVQGKGPRRLKSNTSSSPSNDIR
jgi:molybdopterin biosynthesis enzyme